MSTSGSAGTMAYSTKVNGYGTVLAEAACVPDAEAMVTEGSATSMPSRSAFIVETAAVMESLVGSTNWPAVFSTATGDIPSARVLARSVTTQTGPSVPTVLSAASSTLLTAGRPSRRLSSFW